MNITEEKHLSTYLFNGTVWRKKCSSVLCGLKHIQLLTGFLMRLKIQHIISKVTEFSQVRRIQILLVILML